MSYEIKNYSEEFLEKHVEIGTEVYKGWRGQVQTSLENLKQTYSGENFDPETKFYAFKEDKMVGFLTATIQAPQEDQPVTARMEFPVVLAGHEEANNQLLEKAFTTLKNKGVHSVMSRASPFWGSTKKFVDTQGYQEDNVISRIANVDLNSISVSADTSNVEEFNLERDLEPTIALFKDVFNITDENQVENLRGQFRTLADQVEKIYAQSTIKEGEMVVGRQLVYSPRGQPDRVFLGQVVANEERYDEVAPKLIAKNIEAVKAQGLSKISYSIFGNALQFNGFYI